MDTGVKISLSAHAVLLAAAMFGQMFEADEPMTVQIAEVSLLTSEEFAALLPAAPSAADIVPKLTQPEQPTDQVAILDAPNPPSRPENLTPPTAPEPDTRDTPDVPDVVPLTQPAAIDQEGEAKPEPPVEDATPAPSPRISDTNTPEAPSDAEVAKEAVQATVDTADAEQPAEPATEQAPKQSSTQIVTEAEKPKETAAPVKSVRPKPRPRDLAARQVEPEPDPAPTVEPDPEVADSGPSIEDLLAAAVAEDAAKAADTASTGQQGVPLTAGEQSGLVLAVQQCWSVPIGIQNAADLVVVLSVDLARNGGLKSSPKMIEPTVAQGQIQQAFEAARRALIACAPYDLPPEKYETWKTLEVVFNPKEMVLK